MAQRRMFSPDIVSSEEFLSMPVSCRELYFQLGMHADDDGFIQPKSTMKIAGATEDDLKVLLAKRFLLSFKTGVVVIKHWLIHNMIRSDRYKPTRFQEEKKTLYLKDNKSYTDNNPLGLQNGNQMATQDRIGQDRIGEDSIEKDTYGEFKNVFLLTEEFDKLVKTFGEKNTLILIEELSGYIASKRKKYASHYATLLNWGRRKIIEHTSKLETKHRSII